MSASETSFQKIDSLKGAIDTRAPASAGKVYLTARIFHEKLQADKHVRRDVAERLNHKQ